MSSHDTFQIVKKERRKGKFFNLVVKNAAGGFHRAQRFPSSRIQLMYHYSVVLPTVDGVAWPARLAG